LEQIKEELADIIPMQILIVDDDAKIFGFLRVSLKMAGYDVLVAANGEEALNQVNSYLPDLMVLDLIMPAMDGFEVIKRLRTRSDLPVIVFSAHASRSEEALSLGANDFLTKPFRPDELVEKIGILLHRDRR
jgi:DNA-binding response OmpR family regulator